MDIHLRKFSIKIITYIVEANVSQSFYINTINRIKNVYVFKTPVGILFIKTFVFDGISPFRIIIIFNTIPCINILV